MREQTPTPLPDADDFEAWVAARGAALQRFAYLVTGSAADAPDLVQEALVGAFPRWRELSARETAEAYVRRSIVNASVSRWRKDRRLVSVENPETFVRDRQPDHATDISDADAAWRLCRELPPNQRAAVALRFYEDLPFARIAEILNCTESTARSHVHRAVVELRARLAETSEREEEA